MWIARSGDLSFVLKDTAYELAHRFVRSYIDYDGLLCAGNATEPSQHSENEVASYGEHEADIKALPFCSPSRPSQFPPIWEKK